MDAKVVITLLCIYGGVYYVLARRVLGKIKEVDSDYFDYLGARARIGMSNSVAIMKMLADESIPKKFYPRELVRYILITRIMLGLYPLLLLSVIFLVLVR